MPVPVVGAVTVEAPYSPAGWTGVGEWRARGGRQMSDRECARAAVGGRMIDEGRG